MTAPAIGIDLGTTYSCVAVYRNNKVEIIPNAQGNRITPSVVSFGNERLIGETAKNQEVSNSSNTVFGVKRLIGRRFDEPTVQQDIKQWPFRVISEKDRPKIEVTHKGEKRSFFPEEISSMVLSCMKSTAETYLGKTVRNAVVTVPAYFNDAQRQATKDAAVIAGLNVLRIVNEPTAAALAYGLDDPVEDERNVLIFDLGGGTFDVSVLCIEEGIFEVRSTAGDTHLGGEDIDVCLQEYLAAEFQRRHGLVLSGNQRALRRLRTASERAKRTLSAASEASVELDSLHEGLDFHATITRARFEELCGDLLRRTLEPVRQALADAKLEITEISEVVLVGGSTRIPMVQNLLREFFKGRELKQTVNPDEAVAAGAAVQAAVLDGDPSETVTDLVLLDVTPLSLGTTIREEIMSVIIPRNTPTPAKITKPYTTLYDYQNFLPVEVREGERQMSKENNLLGRFDLPVPCLPAGRVSVQTTFEIDADGILHVSAVDISNNKQKSITITNNKGCLSKEQIEKLIKEAEKFKQEDELKKETNEARVTLEQLRIKLKYRMRSDVSVPNSDRQTITEKLDETLKWMELNPHATKQEYQRKQRDLELLVDLVNMRI